VDKRGHYRFQNRQQLQRRRQWQRQPTAHHPLLHHSRDRINGQPSYNVSKRFPALSLLMTLRRYVPSLLRLLPLSSLPRSMLRDAASAAATAILLPPESPTTCGR
jgi:hypothetical protein